ncbi:MAG: YbjQ family protein [Hellea sp.]
MGLLTIGILLLIGIIFGTMNERNHFSRIAKAEEELSDIKVFNIKTLPDNVEPGGALVTGNVVIAVDYFKVFVAGFIMLFGGRLSGFEKLMERARREALVRMQREAKALGADAIYNTRIEFSAVGQRPKKIGGAELFAYGTAVKYL